MRMSIGASRRSRSSQHCFHTPVRLSQLLVLLLALCALLAEAAAGDLDYWKILGLRRGASEADIKKSYRKLSKKFHPDKNKSEDAEQRFVEVSQAYEVLSDEEKRDIYNKYGHDGLRQHAQTGSAQHHSPFDIFSQFFGGHHGGHSQQARRGPNMVMDMEVDLEDVYNGKTYEITIQRKQICDQCTGTGAKTRDDIVDCHVCQGRGVRIVKHMLAPGMYQQVQMQCDHCNARGKVIKHACPVCKGARIVQADSDISVDIDRGLPEGAELVFEGEADENPDWQAGDLVVRVRTKPMKGGFQRRGSNLYWTETISVADALLGFERDLPHFDNHSIKLKSPSHGGTVQPGHVEVIHGEGLPRYHSSDFGDLFVEYNVVLPENVSDSAAKKLKEAFGIIEQAAGHEEL